MSILLKQRSVSEGVLHLLSKREVGIFDVVADMRSHNEVSNGDCVACCKLTAVVSQVLLHHIVVLLGKLDVSLDSGGLLVRCSEHEARELAEHVCEGVNDRVYVTACLEVPGVVVAIPDSELAEDGAKLSYSVLLAIICKDYLWEATTEFTSIAACLLGFPVRHVHSDLIVGLSVVLKHLSEGITASHTLEVPEGDTAWDDALLGDLLTTRLTCLSTGVATHLEFNLFGSDKIAVLWLISSLSLPP